MDEEIKCLWCYDPLEKPSTECTFQCNRPEHSYVCSSTVCQNMKMKTMDCPVCRAPRVPIPEPTIFLPSVKRIPGGYVGEEFPPQIKPFSQIELIRIFWYFLRWRK